MYRYKLKQNRNIKFVAAYAYLSWLPLLKRLAQFSLIIYHVNLILAWTFTNWNPLLLGLSTPKTQVSLLEIFINILQWTLLILTLIALTVVLTMYQKSKKLLIVLDGFNVNLLNYDNHNPKNEFIVFLA